jgi:glycosyltransferase involved in cell wall biosynthesis
MHFLVLQSNTFWWIAGGILALVWVSRIVEAALGMPTIADIALPEWDRRPEHEPRVSVIVPARNEEQSIREALPSLLALDYSNYEIIAVDDRSTDGTAQMMDGLLANDVDRTDSATKVKLTVIHVAELPPGWMGKTHAMWTAGQRATGEWLLFTDADVIFKPDALRRAVAYAEAERADHLVLFPCMRVKTLSEEMMIAFFQTMFLFGHRPWKVADPKARDHMGVGAFNLVRRRVYESVGTYKALRMEVLDDMKLGKVVKNAGFRQHNVFGGDLISLHWAKGAFGIVDNLTKNFFAILSFQWWRTVASIIGLGFLNLGPFVGAVLARGWARVPFAAALVAMVGIYYGMAKRSEVRMYCFFLHPVSTSLFMYTLLRSMVLTLKNGGVVWRGTKYPLEELRRGMV